jgi:DNA polymerase-3 subunit gamma/tau
MAYQVLARKYRPQRFSDVIGQDHVTRTLKNAIEQGRIAHGYIFSGHRGIGKTTIARILAMALNCRSTDHPVPEPCGVCESCTEVRAGSSVDVIEIDAATNRGIDEIRELRDAARYRPARDRYKIYILDEAHQITDAAFNALLKTLEEPPGHVIFMMATTQPEDIPQTIRSRCQHFSFHAVKFADIVQQLSDIAQNEAIKAEPDAVAALAEAGDGSMRDALSIMDQAIACCGTTLTAELVRGLIGTVGSELMEQLMDSVARNSSEDALRLIDGLITEGQSPSHFARQLVRFLRNCTVAKVAGAHSQLLQTSDDERARVARVAERFSEEDLTRFLNIMLRTHEELGYRQEQRFHLELGILKMVHAQRLLPLEELLSGATSSAKQSVSAPAPRPLSSTPVRTASSSALAPSRTSAASVSPFEADRARKLPEKMSAPETIQSSAPTSIGATAVAVALQEAPDPQPPAEVSLQSIREAIVAALDSAGQATISDWLSAGEWSATENEIHVKVPASAVMLDMSFGDHPRRITTQAASAAAGRPMKLKLLPGAVLNGNGHSRPAPRAASGSARARAAEDPIVRYMQQKFKAEIRTVIDHTEK